MSSLREDISELFKTEVTDNERFTKDGKPHKYSFISAILTSRRRVSNNLDELLDRYNVSFTLVDTDEYESGRDYVYMFTRTYDKSVLEYVEVSSNSYRADQWRFVKPKQVTKTIYV